MADVISQTEVTYGKSIYYKSNRVRLPWNAAVKWKRIGEFNSKLKSKLNKHAAEQSEKLSDLKELQLMQFYKNYYIGLN